jgi:hypothetical protein
MNDDTIADLKQFITTTVRQEVTGVVREEVSGLATKDDVTSLRQEMNVRFNDLQASVAEALETTNDDVHTELRDLKTRVQRLEAA